MAKQLTGNVPDRVMACVLRLIDQQQCFDRGGPLHRNTLGYVAKMPYIHQTPASTV